jgi:hypothetical protein
MAAAGLEFGQVWTLEYLMRRRVLECLCQVAQLSTAQMLAHRDKIHELLEKLMCELGDLSPAGPQSPKPDNRGRSAPHPAGLFAGSARPERPS